MFRFFAVALVIGAFGGALYFSGDALEAWESPKPEAQAPLPAPGGKKNAKPTRHAREASAKPRPKPSRAKKAAPRQAAWLVELNALCRRGKAATDEIPAPTGPSDVAPVLRRYIRLNSRLNQQSLALVQRGNPAAAARLGALFGRDEELLQKMLTTAEKGEYLELGSLAQSLIDVARSENREAAKLGAVDCTVSENELQF